MKVALTSALLLTEVALLAPQKAGADVVVHRSRATVVRRGPLGRTTVVRSGPIRRTTVVRRGPLGRTMVVSRGPVRRTTVVRRGPLGRTMVVSRGPVRRTTVIRRSPFGRTVVVRRGPSGRIAAVGEFRPVSTRRIIYTLPAGSRTVFVRGNRYFVSNGVYYRRGIVRGRRAFIVTTP